MKTNIGDRIKLLRKEMELSQVQLAQRLGVDRSTISKYECGERQVPIGSIVPLAKILRVSTDFLLGNSDQRNIDNKITYADINEILEKQKDDEEI